MTNRSAAEPQWTPAGWIATYSPCWTSKYSKVTEGNRILTFRTACEAEVIAWRTLYAEEEKGFRSETIGGDVSPADALFPSLNPIRKNGSVINVATTKRRVKA